MNATITGETNVGGIIGDDQYGLDMRDNYTMGHIIAVGADPQNFGGLVGLRWSGWTPSYERNYSTMDILGSAKNVGGLVGNFSDDGGSPQVIMDNFYAGNIISGDDGASTISLGIGLQTDVDVNISNNFVWSGASCTNTSGSCNNSYHQDEINFSNFFSAATAPLDQWDFSGVWQEQVGNLPIHRYTSDITPSVSHTCATTVAANANYLCNLTITDTDPNEFRFVLLTEDNTCPWVSRDGGGSGNFIRGYPSASDVGDCKISFVVTDGSNTSPPSEIDVTVTP